MTNEQIKDIALANGFKLKEQPNGEMDLNPYVYDFARALFVERDRGKAQIKSLACLDDTILGETYTETWTDGYDDADEMGAEWRRQMDKD